MAQAVSSRRRLATWLLAVDLAALVALAYSQGVWFPVTRAGEPLQIFVHAGDVSEAPEDSLDAIIAAMRNGADGIEFDVEQSIEGTWWLTHSGPEMSETTTGEGDISLITDAEIAQLRINGGLGYRPELGLTIRLARLTQVLEVHSRLGGHRLCPQQGADGRGRPRSRAAVGRCAIRRDQRRHLPDA